MFSKKHESFLGCHLFERVSSMRGLSVYPVFVLFGWLLLTWIVILYPLEWRSVDSSVVSWCLLCIVRLFLLSYPESGKRKGNAKKHPSSLWCVGIHLRKVDLVGCLLLGSLLVPLWIQCCLAFWDLSVSCQFFYWQCNLDNWLPKLWFCVQNREVVFRSALLYHFGDSWVFICFSM